MSAIKFGESLSKFMIPIALLEKFGSKTFITGIEISVMTRHSSKPNKLRNINLSINDDRNEISSNVELDDDYDYMNQLLPDVIEFLRENEQLEQWKNLFELIS